ncbi:MAG: hypothetical protein K6U80_10510 [Firmicutes bacterium]|nr:hypothetical protein [Bacillota bacterium]
MVKNIIIIILSILVLVGAGWVLQLELHWLDPPLKQVGSYLKLADEQMSRKWIAGISFGTLIFIGALFLIPVFSKQIDAKIYFSNIRQGIVASFVFFGSDWVYGLMENFGKIYKLLSIAVISIVTLILISFGAKFFKTQEAKVEFKSGLVASVTSGLIFGVLLNLITLVINLIKTKI